MKRDETLAELKHLLRYYFQGIHEFFDETSVEMKTRLDEVYACLEQNKNSMQEYLQMINDLIESQKKLSERLSDLDALTERMTKLIDETDEK